LVSSLNKVNQNREQVQRSLLPNIRRFPRTRYQGSKLKLLDWIWSSIKHLEFSTCLDLFSGTSAVAYLFKVHGRAVTTNDYLRCNQRVAKALIVNDATTLTGPEVDALFVEQGLDYTKFITQTFPGIYFLSDENEWLDRVTANIAAMKESAKKSLALFALFQACLAKRPYNLFHRANLYMRTAAVKRSFGNKATWDRPFEEHFREALNRANDAVFSNNQQHSALACGYAEVAPGFDLVYLDPPYLNSRGVGVDYLDFYHFLEGLTEYELWPAKICYDYKHRPYVRKNNPWNQKETIVEAFNRVLEIHRRSIIVISYRSNGIPAADELVALLRRHGRRDARPTETDYQYVLSDKHGKELLFVSEP
jgi:adenine-specific DNA-methyltransferase